MTSTEFVHALKKIAHENAAKGVVASLEQPAGRNPSPELVKLSEWFHQLTQDDRVAIKKVANTVARQAVYNVLLAFDGLLAVDPSARGGKLEIYYRTTDETIRLNQPEEENLSEIFKRNS